MKTVLAYLPVSAVAASTLRGIEHAETIQGKMSLSASLPDFKCFVQSTEDNCQGSTATDGSHCVWCSMSGSGVAGACLSAEEATMANGQFSLSCPLEAYAEVVEKEVKGDIPDFNKIDFNCFKAAWVAENAETACGESKDCVWCQTNGDAAGACLSSYEAEFANGQFGLACPKSAAVLV
ncbi:hypothetical protein ACHAWF_006887 [Thalassiosira exigua]